MAEKLSNVHAISDFQQVESHAQVPGPKNNQFNHDQLEGATLGSKSKPPSAKSTPNKSAESTPNSKKRIPLAVISQNETGAAAAANADVPVPPPFGVGSLEPQAEQVMSEVSPKRVRGGEWEGGIPVVGDSYDPKANLPVDHSFRHLFQTSSGGHEFLVQCVNAPATSSVPRNVFWFVGQEPGKPAFGGSIIRETEAEKFEIKYGKAELCHIPRFGEQVVRMTLGDLENIGISPTKIYAEVSSQHDVGSNISSYLTLHRAGFVPVSREGGDKIRFVHPDAVATGNEIISEVQEHLNAYRSGEKEAWVDKLAEIIGGL